MCQVYHQNAKLNKHFLVNLGQFTDKFVGKEKKVSGNHDFDVLCTEEEIEHRLTAPFTPKTNGMVERAHKIIKDYTIKIEEYKNVNELVASLNSFLLFYIFTKRHGSLKKELGSKVRTPFDALQCWFNIEPELCKISPHVFQVYAIDKLEQRGET